MLKLNVVLERGPWQRKGIPPQGSYGQGVGCRLGFRVNTANLGMALRILYLGKYGTIVYEAHAGFPVSTLVSTFSGNTMPTQTLVLVSNVTALLETIKILGVLGGL